MNRIITRIWFSLCLLFCGTFLFGYDEIVIEEENELGGQTTEYTDIQGGITLGTIYYGSDNTKVKEEKEFTEKSITLYGVEKEISQFFFENLIQKELFFSPEYSEKYLIRKSVEYFDNYTGKQTRVEKFFTGTYLGRNITHFKDGIRTKIEWFYPKRLEGIHQQTDYFNKNGKVKIKVEYSYVERTIQSKGYFKSIYFLQDARKTKEIWYFTKEFGLKNQGLSRRVDNFAYYPDRLTKVTTYFFDQNDKLIQIDSSK